MAVGTNVGAALGVSDGVIVGSALGLAVAVNVGIAVGDHLELDLHTMVQSLHIPTSI